jgi:hypothetical protein
MLAFLRNLLPPKRPAPERDTPVDRRRASKLDKSFVERLEKIEHNLNTVLHHLVSGPHEIAKHAERFLCTSSVMKASAMHFYSGEIICRLTDYAGNYEYYRGDIYKFDFGRCFRRTRNALPKDQIDQLIEHKKLLACDVYHDMPVRIIG